MSQIDSIIGSLGASIEALKKAAAVAEEANIPEEERLALDEMQKALEAMSDRMYDLAMSQGMVRGDMGTMHLELKGRLRKAYQGIVTRLTNERWLLEEVARLLVERQEIGGPELRAITEARRKAQAN